MSIAPEFVLNVMLLMIDFKALTQFIIVELTNQVFKSVPGAEHFLLQLLNFGKTDNKCEIS